MKLLNKNLAHLFFVKNPVQRLLNAVALGAGILLSATNACAQNDKTISYPVAIPIERAASSSSAATVPVYKAPEPVIREIEEASSAPAATSASSRKNVTKNSAKTKSNTKLSNTDSAKKSPAKTTNKAGKNSVSKTVITKTTVTKTTTTKTATNKKISTAKSSVSTDKKNVAAPESIASVINKDPESVAKNIDPANRNIDALKNDNVIKAVIPLVATANAATMNEDVSSETLRATNLAQSSAVSSATQNATMADEEEQLDSLNESEATAAEAQYNSPVTKTTTTTTVTTTGATAVKNLPLPMSSQREKFVNDFQEYVERRIAPTVPGLALAVISEGKVKVLQTYGLKRVGKKDPVDADTVFRLASVSKGFGSAAAAMVVRDGLLNWDAPVTSILPDIEFSNPRYGDQLTVRNILSHSTGLPTQANTNFIEEGLPFDEVARRLRYVNFICPPGKCYNYQNVTYSLIGKIIAKKTGKTYDQYVTEKILNPLGMRTASVGFAGFSATNNYASPHVPARKGLMAVTVNENYYRVNPAAGINASITDMSRWVLAQMGHNPDVLSPAILNAVHAKVTRNTPAQNHYGSREGVTDSHYGLGWRVFDYRGDKNFIHHGGGVMGFRSEVVFNPDLQIGMVVLTNTQRLSGEIIFEFLDAYEDQKNGVRRILPSPGSGKKKSK